MKIKKVIVSILPGHNIEDVIKALVKAGMNIEQGVQFTNFVVGYIDNDIDIYKDIVGVRRIEQAINRTCCNLQEK